MTADGSQIELAIHPSGRPVSVEDREKLLASPGFGRVFTDHMVTFSWDTYRGWHDGQLIPYGPLSLDPATAVLHYSQQVFEGLKAYRQADRSIVVFRPHSNAARFNRSLARMAMPSFPETGFVHAIETLVAQDSEWVPNTYGHSLYLRPFMIATEKGLAGSKPSSSYQFTLIASPAGSYFPADDHRSISVWLEHQYSRAAPGGTGEAKTAGNYSGGLAGQIRALENGCDQVVWLDACEHRHVEEMGVMNLFFVFGAGADARLVTPGLTGTLLPGITRDCLLTLAGDLGIPAEERRISVDEWRAGCESGQISEVFACGTAAVVTAVGSVQGSTDRWTVGDGTPGDVTTRLRERLMGIQYGRVPDLHSWNHRISGSPALQPTCRHCRRRAGVGRISIMTVTEPTTVRALVVRSDDHPALVVPESGTSLSYAELQRSLDRAAGRLAALGVGEGDRVALVAADGPALITAFLAIGALGAAAAPLNPALGVAELTAELDDLRVSRLLHDGAAKAVTAAASAGVPASVIGFSGALLQIDGQAGDSLEAADDPDAFGLLLHTSGTTSKPKTVPIRQRNLVASTSAVAATYGLNADDVTMCVMPLFHVHGLVAAVLATLSTGGTVVVPRFRPSAFWDDVARLGATWYTAVPTIHSRLLTQAVEHPAPGVHRLRFVRSCSAPLHAALWQRYEDAIGVPLVEAYGMTEAAHQMASNPLPPGERRPGTVGRATGVELAALDENWRPVPPGGQGEVSVRGPSVVDHYVDNPDATAASFRDGWFRTGDVGTLTADGYLTLVGRVKELINRAGEKISPYEIEDVLLSHPAVAEAAAYPVPDEKYGEQVGVVVVLRGDATPAKLAEHCRERLAPFKRPARVTILPEIPKGPTGKVQRRNLAALVDG